MADYRADHSTSPTLIVGDTHGDWERVAQIIHKHNPANIIQCGDFGYWPGTQCWRTFNKYVYRGLFDNTIVYWCDGNHEDFSKIGELVLDEDGKCWISPSLCYMSRGSILRLSGKTIMFCGGGASIDKAWRTPGRDWFPEEIISEYTVDGLISTINKRLQKDKIDVVISHTAPDVVPILQPGDFKLPDSTRYVLGCLLKEYDPKRWYFGHWHRFAEGVAGNTHWTALDECRTKVEEEWMTTL